MKPRDLLMYILGGLITIVFFTVLILLVIRAIPEANNEILHVALGALITAFITVVTFFYGSSKGSADKNDMLSKP